MHRHGQQRWLRYSSYAFASRDSAAPLLLHELERAALFLPAAFLLQAGQPLLVAVQGLAPGRNFLVSVDGRWLGGYIPAAYRGYPFHLAKTEDDRWAFCVDEASGLLTHDRSQGEPFFDEDGQLAKPLADVLEFLSQVRAARAATDRACAALQEHQLVKPWPIQLQDGKGEARAVQGLFCVDEAALNGLDPMALQALRDAGALKLAYLQLMSMQHLPTVARFAELHSQPAHGLKVTPSGDLDLEFLNQGGNIGFGNLG